MDVRTEIDDFTFVYNAAKHLQENALRKFIKKGRCIDVRVDGMFTPAGKLVIDDEMQAVELLIHNFCTTESNSFG